MTVTIIIKENTFFAFTCNQKHIKSFKEQRSKDIYSIKKIKMTEDEYYIFRHKNLLKELVEIYLYDGKNDIVVIGTNEEDNNISYICDRFISILSDINIYFQKDFPLKDKYLNIISNATNITNDKNEIQLDTFNIFYILYISENEENHSYKFLKKLLND